MLHCSSEYSGSHDAGLFGSEAEARCVPYCDPVALPVTRYEYLSLPRTSSFDESI